MKLPIQLLATALVLGAPSIGQAQEVSPAKADPAKSVAQDEPVAPRAVEAEASPAGELASVFSTSTLNSLGISPQARVVSVMTNRLDAVELEAVRVEGTLVPVFKRPSLVTFLQLFNPFAPEEFGGTGGGPEGQAFSRAFADPIKTQPTTALFSVGDKPVKAVSTGKPATN